MEIIKHFSEGDTIEFEGHMGKKYRIFLSIHIAALYNEVADLVRLDLVKSCRLILTEKCREKLE